jgi:hypothetical protein
MESRIRNNFDARPYVLVTSMECLPEHDWTWLELGPVRVAVHPTGLVKYIPWEMSADRVNAFLPVRSHIMECVIGTEGRVSAILVSKAEQIARDWCYTVKRDKLRYYIAL